MASIKLQHGLALAGLGASCALAAEPASGANTTVFTFEFCLGATFVALHAYDRFNTPQTNRGSTTAARYYIGLSAYLGLALLTYFVVGRYPGLLQAAGGQLPEAMQGLAPALVAALVLTVLLEKVPGFSAADRWLRSRIQHLASIPYEARRLSRKLQSCAMSIGPEARERTLQRLRNSGFQLGDVQFEPADSVQHLWTRLTVLIDQLQAWAGEARFSGFMWGFAEDRTALEQRYAMLLQKALRRFRMAAELAASPADAKSAELLDALKAEFREQAQHLHSDLCDFISRAVLQCRLSHSARLAELSAVGFHYAGDEPEARLSFNRLSTMFVLTAGILLFGMVVAGAQGGSFGTLLVKVIMIAIIYCVAIACALYPKDRWSWARRARNGERPTASYLLLGVAAALVGLAVSFITKLALFKLDLDLVVADMQRGYPWMLLSFSITVITAFQLDNPELPNRRLQPLLEGILEAALLAVVAWLTFEWLKQTGHAAATRAGFLWMLLATTAINGFLIGFLVPSWYRRAPHEAGAMAVLRAPAAAAFSPMH